jgi:transposase
VAKRPSRAAKRRTHSCATTTPRMRRAIQASEEKNVDLAKRLGVGRKTIAKWKARDSVSDERMGPKNPRSSLLSQEDEVIILAYRWRTRLPLNYCHRRLKRLMPKLSRSALYRCLKRYGLGKVDKTATVPPLTISARKGPFTFEITAIQVVFRNEVSPVIYRVFLAVEEITKYTYAEVAAHTPENAAAFLANLVAEFAQNVITVITDVSPVFTDWHGMFGEDMAPLSSHPFAKACHAKNLAHFRTNLPHAKPPIIRFRGVEIR